MITLTTDVAMNVGVIIAIVAFMWHRIAQLEKKITECITPRIEEIRVDIAEIKTRLNYLEGRKDIR